MPPTNQKEVPSPSSGQVAGPESQTASIVEVDKLHDKTIENINAAGVEAKKSPQDQAVPEQLAKVLDLLGANDVGGGEIGPDAAADMENVAKEPTPEKTSIMGSISEFFKQLYWTIRWRQSQRIRAAETSNHEILELMNTYATDHGYKLKEEVNEHKPKPAPIPAPPVQAQTPASVPAPAEATFDPNAKIVLFPNQQPSAPAENPTAQPDQKPELPLAA